MTSYGDGFLVRRTEADEAIEVNTIGVLVKGEPESYIQVHVSDGNHVKAAIADLGGHSYECKVEINQSVGSEVPCTIAGFGKTRLSVLGEGITVAGKFVGGEDRTAGQGFDLGCDEGEDGGEGIKLLMRGGCTFEEKSLNSPDWDALVIVNSEQNRFVMAQMESKNLNKDDDNLPVTVMVGSTDGDKLRNREGKVKIVKQDNEKIFIKGEPEKGGLVYAGIKSQKGYPGKGEERWPVVQTEETAVQVLSRKRNWGIRIVDKGGRKGWELFIIKVD